jgi:hypothetical protein
MFTFWMQQLSIKFLNVPLHINHFPSNHTYFSTSNPVTNNFSAFKFSLMCFSFSSYLKTQSIPSGSLHHSPPPSFPTTPFATPVPVTISKITPTPSPILPPSHLIKLLQRSTAVPFYASLIYFPVLSLEVENRKFVLIAPSSTTSALVSRRKILLEQEIQIGL